MKLGIWVDTQRAFYKNGKLSSDKVKLLEDLPEWSWDPMGDQWHGNYAALKGYIERNDSIPFWNYETDDGLKLGMWINNQRKFYNKGKLSPDKVKLLEDLSIWSWYPFQGGWNKNYAALKEYIERKGSVPPHGYVTEDGLNIGFWINNQKKAYKNGTLPDNRISLLESFPEWSWDPFLNQWNKNSLIPSI